FSLEDFLTDILYMNNNSTIHRFITHAASGIEFKIKVTKSTSRAEELFTYNIGPEDIVRAFPKPKVKRDAKRIKKVFDWSTAIVSFPPGIKDKAVNFKLEILRAKHTLKHDGYHLGFITDKRE